MSTPQLIILLLVIVVAVVLVLLVVRRSSGKKDEARAEAAGIRADAEAVASSLAGQQVFAQQAEERAALARMEAEFAARAADRLAVEAGEQQAVVEETRADHTSMLRRADEVDPDVRTPGRAVDEPSGAGDGQEADAHQEGDESGATSDDDAEVDREPMTRAEVRQRREESERVAWASSPAAPVAGASGAAVAGAAVRADDREDHRDDEREDHRDDERDVEGADRSEDEGSVAAGDDRSARIATAADYRDSTDDSQAPGGAEETGSAEVWGAAPAGTQGGMTTTSGSLDDPTSDSGADEQGVDPAQDARTPTNEWGGPHEESSAPVDDPEPTVVATTSGEDPHGDPADPTSAPVDTASAADGSEAGPTESDAPGDRYDPTPERDWASDERALLAENEERADRLAQDRADMERDAAAVGMDTVHPVEPEHGEQQGEVVAEQQDGTATQEHDEPEAATGQHEEPAVEQQDDVKPATEQHDEHDAEQHDDVQPTAELHDAGQPDDDQPTAEHHDDGHHDDDQHDDDQHDDDQPTAEHHDAGQHDEPATEQYDEPATEQHDEQQAGTEQDDEQQDASTPSAPRRVSEFDEIRDGGYGMGSAAVIDDGAQPLDHPVAAYHDTMTFREAGAPGYDDARPDVWFYDAGAAERSGFRRSEG